VIHSACSTLRGDDARRGIQTSLGTAETFLEIRDDSNLNGGILFLSPLSLF
jgi:hypothetical protein